MSRRGYIVMAILAGCLAIPVIIGASCPPPDDPPFFSIIPSPSTTTQEIPSCEPDRICVSIINLTCLNSDVILYIHNGFDLTGQYVTRTAIECCENSTSATSPCPCFRPGSDNGELQLTRPELFQPANRFRFTANGELVDTLPGRSSRLTAIGGRVTESIPCGDVKSIGIEVAPEGDLPGAPQERSGPDYRCTMTNVDRGDSGFPEQVPCGETIQFSIVDRNDCANQDLTVYRVNMGTSKDCSSVQQNQTGGSGGSGGMGMGGGGFGG
jgi:hypothetical protein